MQFQPLPLPWLLAEQHAANKRREALAKIRAEYFAGGDLESIAGAVSKIDRALAQAYYDGTLDPEEFISSLS